MDPEGAAEVSPPPTVWGCRIHPPTLSTSRSGASPKYRHGGWILAAPSPGVGMGTPSTGTRGSRQRPRRGRLCSPPRRQRVRPGRGGGARGVTPKLRLLGWCALGQVLGGVPGHPQTLLEPAPTGRPWAGGLEPGATAVLVPATPSPSPMPGGGPREGSDQAGGPEGCDPPPRVAAAPRSHGSPQAGSIPGTATGSLPPPRYRQEDDAGGVLPSVPVPG